jgi:hypothetical protein
MLDDIGKGSLNNSCYKIETFYVLARLEWVQ